MTEEGEGRGGFVPVILRARQDTVYLGGKAGHRVVTLWSVQVTSSADEADVARAQEALELSLEYLERRLGSDDELIG